MRRARGVRGRVRGRAGGVPVLPEVQRAAPLHLGRARAGVAAAGAADHVPRGAPLRLPPQPPRPPRLRLPSGLHDRARHVPHREAECGGGRRPLLGGVAHGGGGRDGLVHGQRRPQQAPVGRLRADSRATRHHQPRDVGAHHGALGPFEGPRRGSDLLLRQEGRGGGGGGGVGARSGAQGRRARPRWNGLRGGPLQPCQQEDHAAGGER
mmetsp:Transcript_13460/g.28613  ORF Transcript_13460/g.28613 Transcript_13460/m.28613 type:complete len:209 (+) Transcript_13460:1138-1764(+)